MGEGEVILKRAYHRILCLMEGDSSNERQDRGGPARVRRLRLKRPGRSNSLPFRKMLVFNDQHYVVTLESFRPQQSNL